MRVAQVECRTFAGTAIQGHQCGVREAAQRPTDEGCDGVAIDACMPENAKGIVRTLIGSVLPVKTRAHGLAPIVNPQRKIAQEGFTALA